MASSIQNEQVYLYFTVQLRQTSRRYNFAHESGIRCNVMTVDTSAIDSGHDTVAAVVHM